MRTLADERTVQGQPQLNNLSPTQQDEVINHVLAGRRAVATLMLYRLQDCTLEEAWYTMNAISDNSNFEHPDQDLGFTRLENYLRGRSPWRETKYFLGAASLFLLAGAAIVFLKWPSLQTGIESFFWTKSTASIVGLRFTEKSRLAHTGSRRTTYHMHYRYRYTVADETHVGRGRRSYLPDWDSVFEIGDSIQIVYNPNQADESLHDRNMYSWLLGVVVGLLVMSPGLIILGFGGMFAYQRRQFRKHDPLMASVRPSTLDEEASRRTS